MVAPRRGWCGHPRNPLEAPHFEAFGMRNAPCQMSACASNTITECLYVKYDRVVYVIENVVSYTY